MIARDAEPIAHRAPYKRIDLARPRLKAIITEEDIQNGAPEPDPRLYDLDFTTGAWRLKP